MVPVRFCLKAARGRFKYSRDLPNWDIMRAGRLPSLRLLDYTRLERREMLAALALFLVLAGLVSIFGEFFMDLGYLIDPDMLDGDLFDENLLTSDSGLETLLVLGQLSLQTTPVLWAFFTLQLVYPKARAVPIPAAALRPWVPPPSGKVPI